MNMRNKAPTIEHVANNLHPPTCRHCGHTKLTCGTVSMAFWRSGRLIVIGDVPAMTCETCRGQNLADETVLALDRMRGDRLTSDNMVEAMIVPVYRFDSSGGDKP